MPKLLNKGNLIDRKKTITPTLNTPIMNQEKIDISFVCGSRMNSGASLTSFRRKHSYEEEGLSDLDKLLYHRGSHNVSP